MLALEREENAFGRLVRGLVSRHRAGGREGRARRRWRRSSLTAVMLAVLAAFARARLRAARRCGWSRWRVGALAFGAMGVAIGGLTREVRVGVAARVRGLAAGRVLALIPSGAVSDGPLRRHQGRSRASSRSGPRCDALDAAISGGALLRPCSARALRSLGVIARLCCGGCVANVTALGRVALGLAHLQLLNATTIAHGLPRHPPAPPRASTGVLRDLVRETELSRRHLVYPMFVVHGADSRTPIADHAGHRPPLDPPTRCEEAGEAAALGIPAVLLFGLPAAKDEEGSGAWDDEGVIQLATRAIKAAHPDLLVITDLCLCEYTSHGHCGVLRADGVVDNDATLELLARTAVSQAAAGADAVAPSDMMDGRVGALRAALDEHGLSETPIIAYSAKFASAFYGPFREAADSAPAAGRPPRLPDGSRQRARGRARGRARRRRGRRHRHGQARAALPRRDPPRQGRAPACPSPPTTSAASTR